MVLRRLLFLIALSFWQGGGAFYGAVAIPIGRRVLREHAALQSVITRDVTGLLNWVGAVALLVMAMDIFATDSRGKRRRPRTTCWLGMVVCHGALFYLYSRLVQVYAGEDVRVQSSPSFHSDHKLYLWTATCQFIFGMALLMLSLRSWRAADGMDREPSGRSGGDVSGRTMSNEGM